MASTSPTSYSPTIRDFGDVLARINALPMHSRRVARVAPGNCPHGLRDNDGQSSEAKRAKKRRVAEIMKLVAFGRSPYSRPQLIRMHPQALLWMYVHATHLKRRLRASVKAKLMHILTTTHRTPPLKTLMVIMPCNFYRMRPIRMLLKLATVQPAKGAQGANLVG